MKGQNDRVREAPGPHSRQHVAGASIVDLTPRWRTLVPILLSALEGGTERGRSNARRSLRNLACEADAARHLQMRTRTALARIVGMWPKGPDELTDDEREALAEAATVLAIPTRTLLIGQPETCVE